MEGFKGGTTTPRRTIRTCDRGIKTQKKKRRRPWSGWGCKGRQPGRKTKKKKKKKVGKREVEGKGGGGGGTGMLVRPKPVT